MTLKSGNNWRATSLQKAMLLASMKTSDFPVFIMQRVISLPDNIDETTIKKAWLTVVEHHSILRAQFTFNGADVFQYHLDTSDSPDSFNYTTVNSPKGIEEVYHKDYNKPFVFDSYIPLWRLHFINKDNSPILCLTFHHTIIDQRSVNIILRDFETALSQLQLSKPPTLPKTQGFHDYLEWHEKQHFENLKDKWLEYVAPLKNPTLLPEELSNEQTQHRFSSSLDNALSNKLREFAKQHDLTPNTIILGAWALILSRMTFQDCVSFGVVRGGYANSIPEAKTIAGPLLKTLPLIQPLLPKQTTLKYLTDVKLRRQFLYEADHCPTELLMNWTGLEDQGSLLSTVFNYVKRNENELTDSKETLPFSLIHTRHSTALEPTVSVNDSEEFIGIKIISPNKHKKFSQTAAKALEHVIVQLLDSSQKIESICLCPDEKENLLRLAQGPACEFENHTLTQFIETSFTDNLSNLAIDGVVKVTYNELDKYSRSIADKLNKHNFNSKCPVAIVLPAGMLCIATMIAALRSGGSFICVNPNNPINEALAILKLTKAEIVVSNQDLLEELNTSDWKTIALSESDFENNQAYEFTNTVSPNDLSYLVYTSGTTGTPKVIQIEHHSIANLVSSILPVYSLKPGDRRFQRSQPGPDFFIAEILLTLCAGATLVFPESTDVFTPSDFFAEIEKHEITTTGMPSSYWRELVRSFIQNKEAKLPPSLRLVIIGMETVDSEMLRVWNEMVPPEVELLNVYGPSETTMIASHYSLRDGVPENETLVPIGTPVPNTATYILDSCGQPLPIGSLGEICIAGEGVMRGYAGSNPETDFQNNTNDNRPEFSKLYRTGDYGFYNHEGNLIFSGRRDGQVKIRGHRIELATVETHLSIAADGASAIAVISRRGNQNILVGIVESDNSLNNETIRTDLRKSVKDVLVPSVIMLIEKFPRLPNGKLNRQLLKKKADEALETETSLISSQNITGTRLEKMIAIWNLLFETKSCSAHSNFFDLGGDSLLAVRLSALVEQHLHIKLPLNYLYISPSVSGLLQQLEQETETHGSQSPLVALAEGPGEAPIFTVHGWGGQPLLWRPFAAHFEGERACWGIQAAEHSGKERPLTMQEMCNDYAEAIVKLYPKEPIIILGHSLGGIIAYETARCIEAKGGKVKRIIILDTYPSNITKIYHITAYVPYFIDRAKTHLRALLTGNSAILPFLKERWTAAWQIIKRGGAAAPIPVFQENPAESEDDYYQLLAKYHTMEKSKIPFLIVQCYETKRNIRLAWSSLAKGPIDRVFVDSNHLDLPNEPVVSTVAQIVKEQPPFSPPPIPSTAPSSTPTQKANS